MESPDRIHVNWNAADGYPRLLEAGIRATTTDKITSEDIFRALQLQKGRLFRLPGWTENPDIPEVLLDVSEVSELGLLMRNRDDPPFEAYYDVAPEPQPKITTNGDYQFVLTRADVNQGF